jgi:hypothetical protein
MLLIFACLSKSGHRRLEGFFEDFGMERPWLGFLKIYHPPAAVFALITT